MLNSNEAANLATKVREVFRVDNQSIKTFTNRRSVRKTLTIDADIAEEIENRLNTTRQKEKFVVNELLRKGLIAVKTEKIREPFELVTFPVGLQEGVTTEDIEKILDEI